MNQSIQAARVGLFFILGLALIYVVYTIVGNKTIQKENAYTLIAPFSDLKGLTVGSDVRIAGVRVGAVQSTRLDNGRGIAELHISNETSIPTDSEATIVMSSLLGQNLVSIKYGKASTSLSQNQSIITQNSADLNDIIKQVSNLGEKLNTLADSFSSGLDSEEGPLGDFSSMIKENREQVATVVKNLEQITNQLNSTNGTLGKLINDNTAHDQLITMTEEIRSAATEARTIMQSAQAIIQNVQDGKGTMGKLFYDDQIANDLQSSINNFKAFSNALNSGQGTLGKLVTDDELYTELRAMLKKADQALDSVGDSGPMTAVGAAAGAIF